MNRGFEQRRKRQSTETFRQRDPRAHGTRHGDAVPAEGRHRRRPAKRSPSTLGRTSRCVEPHAPSRADDRERIAADAVVVRFDDRQRNRGRDRRIYRVAAAPHRVEARAAANGCDVATTLLATIGIRCEG